VSDSRLYQFWHQNFKIPLSNYVLWRRFPKVAICTLAALTTHELAHQAIAFPSQGVSPEEASRVVIPEQTEELIPTQAIASPESVSVQEFSRLSIPPQAETEPTHLRVEQPEPVSSYSAKELLVAAYPEEVPTEATMAIVPPVVNQPLTSPAPVISQVQEPPQVAEPNITVPSQEEIQNLQQQLRNVEIIPEFGRTTEGSPALTIVTPTGFGADNNTGFVSATYQGRTRYSDVDDGAVGFGVGLGDARRSVGVELSYTIASFGSNRSFGSGGFNAKVHRQLSEDFAAAVGWNGFLNIGDRNDFEHSIYGVATKIFRTQADINKPFSRVAVSAGLGNGQFRTEDDTERGEEAVNVFGSVALRVARPVSFIAEWTGQDLGLGLSIAPFRNFPLVITPAVRDITGAGDGTRFVLGTGFGFKF